MPGRSHDDDDVAPFAALRRPAVEALARILYFRHATTGAPAGDAACRGWLRRQKRAVADLRDAPALRRPRALSLLGDLFCGCFHHGAAPAEGPRALLRAEADAALCPSHRALSPRVLAALAALVEEEARQRLDQAAATVMRRTREKKKEEEEEEVVVVEVAMWMESAARVAALWTGRRRWEERMGRPLDLGLPALVSGAGGGGGGCAACRLAVVGGSPQFLTDLRAGLVARHEVAVATARERRVGTPEPPVLLRMVEAWIDTCYARRRRRRIRRESDWIAALVLRRRLGGGGGGGGRDKRSGGGGEGRRRAGCWPARDEGARLMMEVDVEALFLSSDEEDEEGEAYVVEYVQGRWRRATSRKQEEVGEEGYVPPYLPTGTFAAVMRVMPERRSRSSSTRQRQSAETKASPPSPPPPAKSDDSSRSAPAAPSPPPPPPSSSLRASASTVVADSQPRTTAGSPTPVPRTWAAQQPCPPPSPPLSLAGEAELAAIYDAYYRAAAATTTTIPAGGGIRGSPSPPCVRSVPRPRTVSPLSNHGCVAAAERGRRDDDDVESLHPRPLRTRHQRRRSSGIPVPKHPTAAGMPRVSSVHSVSSTVLLGCGGRRWSRPVEGC